MTPRRAWRPRSAPPRRPYAVTGAAARPGGPAAGARWRPPAAARAAARAPRSPAHRPEALGDAGHEGEDEEGGECVVRGPVDPQGREEHEHGAQSVGSDHGPAPVERPLLGRQRGERPEEYGSEEQRGQNACPEDGRHGEGDPAVATAEGTLRDRRLKDEDDQHEQGQGITDTAHQVGAPQPFQLRSAQQRADGALAGIRDQGVVGGRSVGRWLLGSRHPASLSGPTDCP